MEESADGSPDLAGDAFFRLAVDPRDRENVVAATTLGIYQRVPANSGNHEWVQRRTNICSSVVVARNGDTTRFFAAEWGGDVFQSEDGENWTTAGTGFPTTGMGRIALAVLFDRPELIYAFVANNNGGVGGIFRLDSIGGTWKEVRNVPNVLPGEQGSYDLDIAIDPNDENLLYLAGDHMGTYPWAGSVWRTRVEPEGTNFRCSNSASIGTHAHADVHVLVHSPGNSNELWCGTDGGLFLNRNPRGNGEFGSRNQGLSCLCCNFIAQHPTDPNILFSGLQDNGTAMTESPPIWTGVAFGDGGYCLMNWADPLKVLIFQNGWARRSTTGGASDEAWSTNWEFQWATMTQPIVGAPYNPSNPSEGDIVAFAAGTLVFISEDFAESQPNQSFDIPSASGRIFSLAFASPNRLFVGTTRGRVFRADRDNTLGWVLTRLDDVTPGRLPLTGLVSDVAVDWSDTDLESIYISFSGMGDHRRVWHFNGTIWEDRSGSPGATDLLDVEHNALVVDPQAPNNVYVGADIGVWHSADSGLNWNPFQNGLPDAPVFDLQIHPTQRLLRAATHGRGVYEIKLD